MRASEVTVDSIISPVARKRSVGRGTRRRIAVASVFLVLLAGFSFGFTTYLRRGTRGFVVKEYSFGTVVRQPIYETMIVNGVARYADAEYLKAPRAGILETMFVQDRQVVAAETPIFRINNPSIEEDIHRAIDELGSLTLEREYLVSERNISESLSDRSVTRAQAMVTSREKSLATFEVLFKTGSCTREALEETRAALASARLDLEDAIDRRRLEGIRFDMREQALEREIRSNNQLNDELQIVLSNMTVYAPFDGVVRILERSEHDEVLAAAPILYLFDDTLLEVRAPVPIDFASSLSPDNPITCYIDEHKCLCFMRSQGVEVSRELDHRGTVDVRFRVEGAAAHIASGTPARLEIRNLKRADAMVLPRGAYMSSGHERVVYRIEGDGAERVEATFGVMTDTDVEVLNGLQVGDVIITSSYEEFIDQSYITIENGDE